MSPQRLAFRRLVGRRRWPVVDGKVIDKRHLRTRQFKSERVLATISYDEYLVEVAGPDGTPVRLRIQEDHGHLPKQMKLGTTWQGVGVKVHVKGDKAVFAKDPTESRSERKRREQERLARDEERFRRQEGR